MADSEAVRQQVGGEGRAAVVLQRAEVCYDRRAAGADIRIVAVGGAGNEVAGVVLPDQVESVVVEGAEYIRPIGGGGSRVAGDDGAIDVECAGVAVNAAAAVGIVGSDRVAEKTNGSTADPEAAAISAGGVAVDGVVGEVQVAAVAIDSAAAAVACRVAGKGACVDG